MMQNTKHCGRANDVRVSRGESASCADIETTNKKIRCIDQIDTDDDNAADDSDVVGCQKWRWQCPVEIGGVDKLNRRAGET